MTTEIYNKVIFILHNTNDGDDLDPCELFLVENIVNEFLLTEEAKQQFENIFNRVTEQVKSTSTIYGL